ncbi:UDP-glucose--hexose-1-phosphate uridylyltransferase [Lactobacillus delbrueckii]|jgi:UDPglucose--hexose-1-phosphate uridylyltransferase|uniref:UDP-glucose--hexose-1-phosphate uridylyltransferase n=1 Tax=Lactobacillus delbrueckii TaxID=1584 RepID=UPI003A843150
MLIENFVQKIIANTDYQEMDRVYLFNRLQALVGDGDIEEKASGEDSLLQLIDLAVKRGKITDDVTSREILADQLADFLTPAPSKVNGLFWNKYDQSPKAATDWFYDLSTHNNYVKKAAITKNIVFSGKSSYGHPLEITINLSKPEKDPKAIAAAAKKKDTDYPKCDLCLENEGYLGDYGKNARSNLRIIRMNIGGEKWGMQYSPYAYFNEHCIFLDQIHEPMVINQQTLINLLEIVKTFPHYMVGSNADLPIVGGSLLSHEHYQGGGHRFPMMNAPVKKKLTFASYPQVKGGIVDWPMSDIRLISQDTEALIELGTKIIKSWQKYSDPGLGIVAEDKTARHHTVTPIAHKDGDEYVLELVLRDNSTSSDYPLGIFHPHQDKWHIKKENIGLIEVMGRAILPGRLKGELGEVKKYLLGQDNQIAKIHLPWAKKLQEKQPDINEENVDQLLQQALLDIFDQVLADAGVYKADAKGEAGWQKFLQQLGAKN